MALKYARMIAVSLLPFALLANPAAAARSVSDLRLDTPVTTDRAPRSVATSPASGEIEIVIQLQGPSIAEAHEKDAKKNGRMLSKKAQRDIARALESEQSGVMASVAQLGGREVARLTKVLNAVIVSVDASKVAQLSDLPGVISVRPVGEYEMDLTDTVPYIGAAMAQAEGIDGTGVTVAVLDSGIDYTHKNLGGPGTFPDYLAAWGTGIGDPLQTTTDGLFPTDKVIGGYDFVGELWPTYGPRSEDPDPIDYEGHGTHVADIIAGQSLDGTHVGVAPGARLFAIKVCSAVSSSCNGEALLLGMEYALDPNGDGDISDAVDVINLSLGSSYGQIEDDLSLAASNAVRLGVVVVASAGNSADRPYIVGSPSSTPEVISVAQTQVPSAEAIPLKVNSPAPATYGNTATIDWAPIVGSISADLLYPDTNRLAGAEFPAGTFDGKIAVIDRGSVSISFKVYWAQKAGALAVILVNNAPGAAPSFSFGGLPEDPPAFTDLVPTLVVGQEVGNVLKSQLAAGAVNATIEDVGGIPLAGSMVASSSRGPSVSFNAIKPDIGAPGASISAVVGTGDGVEAFGGTSGAAPMVSGAAALLLEAYPKASVGEIKARLMNNGNTEVYTNPATQPGDLAPITRIGGGEVQVDQAIAAMTAAWAEDDSQGHRGWGWWNFGSWDDRREARHEDRKAKAYAVSLSFGFQTVPWKQIINQTVRVTNYANRDRTYTINPTFRYADDAASGAVKILTPRTIRVKKNSSATFKVLLYIDGSKLPFYVLNGGPLGGTGASLQVNEFDGYLVIADRDDSVNLPWQVLPHKAADVKLEGRSVNLRKGKGDFRLRNWSPVLDGEVEVFDLLGSSPKIKKQFLPGPGDNLAVIDLKSVGAAFFGFDGGGYPVGGIAISAYGRRAHPNYPAGFEIQFFIDDDDEPDYIVYNAELGGAFAADGRNAVYQGSIATGYTAYFLSDAQLNSGNIILPFYLDELPNWSYEDGATVRMAVLAYDNYFTGIVSDVIEVGQYTFGLPKYDGGGLLTVPAWSGSKFPVTAVPGGAEASPSQTGLLLMYRDGANRESEEVLIK
ncbi:MAG: S8 family serine peptidase [Opitutaceae bacterium]